MFACYVIRKKKSVTLGLHGLLQAVVIQNIQTAVLLCITIYSEIRVVDIFSITLVKMVFF